MLILAAVLAFGIAMAGAYMVVLSQNPGAAANAPTVLYGSTSP